MQLGFSVATRSGLGPTEIAALALTAERAGFDAYFVAERVADSLSLCHSALAATHSITVGTAIANARLRHPALMAMTAATIDESGGGRFMLGLGSSNAHLNEAVLRLAPVRPVPFMRDYVGQLRCALACGPKSQADAAPIDEVQFDRPAGRRTMRIVLGALLPSMLRLAGEIADGVVLNLTTPTLLPSILRSVADGAAISGRRLQDLVVACVMPCSVDGDDEVARRAGQDLIVGYAQHPAAARVFTASAYSRELQEIAERLSAGDRAGALRMVSDEMIDEFLLHGDARACRERIARYREAGVVLPILFPIAAGGHWTATLNKTIAFAAEKLIQPVSLT